MAATVLTRVTERPLSEIFMALAFHNLHFEPFSKGVIHTRDIAKGLELARRIETGICHINGPTVADEPQMPFGGVKDSGYGHDSVLEYTREKAAIIQI